MLIPRILRLKQVIREKIGSLNEANGAQFTPTLRQIDDNLTTQADIEVTCVPLGYEERDLQALEFTEVDVFFEIVVSVKGRINDIPIDEVCLLVHADIERALMEDVTQGGEARDTQIEGSTRVIDDKQPHGTYAWLRVYSFYVSYPLGDPLTDD